jgi:hypothetical protein
MYLGGPLISFNALIRHRSNPGGLRQVLCGPAARAGTGSRRLSGGWNIAPSGNWALGSQAFAISRGPTVSSPRTPGHEKRFEWHAIFPFAFRFQVGYWAQGYHLQSLPTAWGIYKGASWRSADYPLRGEHFVNALRKGTRPCHPRCPLRRQCRLHRARPGCRENLPSARSTGPGHIQRC